MAEIDMKEKLVELVHKARMNALWHNAQKPDEYITDMLMEDGVTVQECKGVEIDPFNKWISVKDRFPEDDLPKDTKKKMIRCLVYTDKGTIKPCVRQRWEHFDGQLVPWQWNKDLYAKPTHWMHYPQPPKGE